VSLIETRVSAVTSNPGWQNQHFV